MALPRGMFRRGGKLWARKDVPKPLQSIIGQTSLQSSLRTDDVNAARALFHGVMQTFEARIAAAKKALAENKPMPFEPVGRGYGKVPIPVLVDALEKIAFDVTIPKWKAA